MIVTKTRAQDFQRILSTGTRDVHAIQLIFWLYVDAVGARYRPGIDEKDATLSGELREVAVDHPM